MDSDSHILFGPTAIPCANSLCLPGFSLGALISPVVITFSAVMLEITLGFERERGWCVCWNGLERHQAATPLGADQDV